MDILRGLVDSGTMQSLVRAQEATGKAHVTIQVGSHTHIYFIAIRLCNRIIIIAAITNNIDVNVSRIMIFLLISFRGVKNLPGVVFLRLTYLHSESKTRPKILLTGIVRRQEEKAL
jgi:hypothetical protein